MNTSMRKLPLIILVSIVAVLAMDICQVLAQPKCGKKTTSDPRYKASASELLNKMVKDAPKANKGNTVTEKSGSVQVTFKCGKLVSQNDCAGCLGNAAISLGLCLTTQPKPSESGSVDDRVNGCKVTYGRKKK